MPDAGFFRKLGLFVEDEFLDAATCARIVAEMRAAPAERGTVVGKREARDKGGVIDESGRKVWTVQVGAATELEIAERLDSLRPKLETHFDVRLSTRSGPHFLKYDEGGFYVQHSDVRPDAPLEIRRRVVSVVAFLNPWVRDRAIGDGYGGGELVLYSLIDDPGWKEYGFSLEPAAGILIAYRSQQEHQIKPVKFGQRFTIVAWFSQDAA